MISPRFCYYLLLLGAVADAAFNFGIPDAPLQNCIGDVVNINDRVLVRMIGSPEDLTSKEIELFESKFLETYNFLSILACYGGSYTTITSVNVQEDFLNIMEVRGDSPGSGTTREFTLRVQILGTCLGCEKDSLFTLPAKRRLEAEDSDRGFDEDEDSEFSHYSRGDTGASESARYNSQADRDTQEELEDFWEDEDDLTRRGGKGKGKGKGTPFPSSAPSPIPPCPDCVPPTQNAFELSLNAGLAFLKVNSTLVNIDSVEQVTELDEIPCESEITNFTTDVFIDFLGDGSQVDGAQLRNLEHAFLQTYNELNLLGSGTCDDSFRQIIGVQAELGGNLNRRRNLQTSVLEVLPFSILFQVSAICRNCGPTSVLFSFPLSRILQSTYLNGGNNYRALQGASNDQCFCPREAESRTPNRVEFQNAFSVALNSDQYSNITFINSVGRALEVDAVNCSGSVDFFQTTYTAEFSGNPENFTSTDINQLENLFVESYNELQEKACDPLFRTVVNATLIREVDTSMQRDLQSIDLNLAGSFTYLFSIRGRCRFCGDDSTLFGNDAIDRRHRELIFLDDGTIVDPGSYGHRLQKEEGTCFCDVKFLKEQNPPSTGDFAFTYDRNVQGEVEGVGNVKDVAIFITESPSLSPSDVPSVSPTSLPSSTPTFSPSQVPSFRPSSSPSDFPSLSPSDVPSDRPSDLPSDLPSRLPSIIPSGVPSIAPQQPTPRPTANIKRPTNPPNGRRINEGAATEKGPVRRGRSPIRRQQH